ncbi:hypothetical protein Q8W25_20170, partial [Shimia thalassica]|uniref:hypothetical protein n=1 Tax=Shimia thalassica TaxID=1715693 RepID=UPI0027367192
GETRTLQMGKFDDWIAKHRPDCPEIPNSLKSAIAYYVLIWSYFEAHVVAPADARLFARNHNAGNTHNVSNWDRLEEAAKNGLADFTSEKAFVDAYEYFKGRHMDGVNKSDHLDTLTEQANKMARWIEAIYTDEKATASKKIETLLLVAYCLRTNLIHGYKWHSGLVGQEQNFYHAATVLMLAVDNIKHE